VITNDVSDYITFLVRIAHIIFNHTLYMNIILITDKNYNIRNVHR